MRIQVFCKSPVYPSIYFLNHWKSDLMKKVGLQYHNSGNRSTKLLQPYKLPHKFSNFSNHSF